MIAWRCMDFHELTTGELIRPGPPEPLRDKLARAFPLSASYPHRHQSIPTSPHAQRP